MSHLIARPASFSSITFVSAMTARATLALVALLALLAGCSARQGAGPSHAPSHGPAYEASAESYGGAPSAAPAGAPSAAPADAPSRMSTTTAEAEAAPAYDQGGEGAYREQPREQPRERPGLGTVFGETRASAVRRSQFVRASSQPVASVVLHYNDLEGVRAHAQHLGQDGLMPFHATPFGGIDVSLVDEYGNVLPGGTSGNRNLIVGQEGQRYEIIVRNLSAGRFEVVGSVDGLDVVDGLPAHFEKRGYVLEPHGVLRIEGWRRSTSEVAAFRFGRVSESYAARTTGDRNVGVIGVVFFAEQGSAWTPEELEKRDSANPFPSQSGYAQPPPY